MKHLRKFENADAVKQWQMSADYANPNVVLMEDTGEIAYNLKSMTGVYLQHIDGTLYTKEEWKAGNFSNDAANGIAVIDPAAQFVIAKTKTSYAWASDMSNLISDLPSLTSADALEDYAGEENTRIMLTVDTGRAAYYCANYTFPNGAKGYLPALGELKIANKYITEINGILALLGLSNIVLSNYWSSSQAGKSQAWTFDFYGKKAAIAYKNYSHYVQPFTSLEL